jgi:hypothetical protein
VPYVWLANAEQRETGLHLHISEVQRIPPSSVDPTAKNYHWNDLTMGLLGALDRGGDSAVLVDAAGHVVEGPGFNVFCVSRGAIVTPDAGMLEGITRRTVIEMAQALGLPLHCRALPADELRQADEVFLSSSAGGVLPVTRLDGRMLADGATWPDHPTAGGDLLGLACRPGPEPTHRLHGVTGVGPLNHQPRLVGWLSLAQLVSWGSTFYLFALLMAPVEQALGLSRAESHWPSVWPCWSKVCWLSGRPLD